MAKRLIPNLKMAPYNTTLMGVLKGVADYYGLPTSGAWLFGASGHAFLINIHEELCPSGPYCWNADTFRGLVRNLGILMQDLGFFSAHSGPRERAKVEEVLKRKIDAATPCSLLNMENQLISGYDDARFILEKPWPRVDLAITPETLTFGTWRELGEEVHVDFHAFTRTERADDETTIRQSLGWAVDMTRAPGRYTEKPYHAGLEAYDAWIDALRNGHGSSHGNWWNGTVWSECREMAAGYFTEIGQRQPRISKKAGELSTQYRRLADLLRKASDKELVGDGKIKILQEAKRNEESGIGKIQELLDAM